jgi:YVTN family beta-propeller protein
MKTPDSRRTLRFLLITIIMLSLVALWLVSGQQLETASAQALGANTSFRNFEAPQVHPLALTPDGKHLLAVNTPNASLSVFELSSGTPVLAAEIPVGLQPVSVAARTEREVWVVNWLSDSVSIVDLTTGNVRQTIDVGDEPTDILFAGPGGQKAFVCVSGGGRQTIDGIPITGASGAIKIFDPANLSTAPQVIEILAKQPRALARDASGGQVFVSVFESGNQTTLIPQPIVAQNGGLPPPNPAMRSGLPAATNTGLIVKWNGSAWADETGDTKWDPFVTYTLADIDLIAIDASAANPTVSARVRNLGTNLGNMTFDPATGRLFVANMDSANVRRFEPNLRGRFQSIRVSVLNTSPGGVPSIVSVNDMNPHVNFNNPAGTDTERAQSLALPADITRASDGTVYLAATSSAKVGFLNSAGAVVGRIAVGQGPTGLALDEVRQRLYVLNRFDQSVSLVDTATKSQVGQVSIGSNPEPLSVRNGRRFLYDAVNFSAHGTVSCASCHPSGHRDGLAWDLGDPTGDLVAVGNFTHHPMKGPMMVQSLRGLLQSSPLHWRADRNNFGEFNIAFPGLLGSTRLLTTDEMNAFQTFVETMVYPPNPNENANRTFPNHPGGPNAQAGFDRFRSFRGLSDIFLGNANNCNACHSSAPLVANLFSIGTARLVFNGNILSEPQAFKVPQLRGIYQKLGLQKPAPGQPRSEQLTGFGLMHDGAIDTLLNFMRQPDFIGFHNDDERREIEAFLMAFDSVIAPAVGLQVTVNASNKNSPDVLARVNLLIQQAQPLPIFGSIFPSAPNCDLVVRGIYGGAPRAFLQLGNGVFRPDSGSEANLTLQQLLSSVGEGAELTFTGVPEGEGRRYSIDRDANGILNDDEPRTSVQLSGRVVDASGNGIGGVAVMLSGKQSAAAVTDASGNYAFNFVSTSGAHTVTPARAGLTFSPLNRSFTNPTWNQSATFISSASGNVSDVSPFFVAQHYSDFLSRTPDSSGLQFWTDQIESCGGDADCRRLRRDNVSGAFFLSIEFKETGYLVYRTYKASFGDLPGKPVPVTFQQLMTDTQRLGRNVIVNVGNWQQQIETNKQAFFVGWVQRSDFIARYPASISPAAFVDAFNANTGGSLSAAERDALVSQLTSNNTAAGRALVVRQVSENAEFSRRQINRAFVLMQYFGYLRHNPDDAPEAGLNFDGYNFWLAKLDQFNGNFIQAEMVKSFIVSSEYRQRFGQ